MRAPGRPSASGIVATRQHELVDKQTSQRPELNAHGFRGRRAPHGAEVAVKPDQAPLERDDVLAYNCSRDCPQGLQL